MRVSEAFPSKFLKAEDLRGRKVEVKIKNVEMEKIGDDYKPVLYFSGKDKSLTLNKVNSLTIAKIIGTDEMDEWIGKKIVLKPDITTYQGKPVDCIRVEAPAAASAPAALPADTSDDDDREPLDDIDDDF